MTIRLACAGCGFEPDPASSPFRCPKAGDDDVDHLIHRVVDLSGFSFPSREETSPFIAFRTLMLSHQVAIQGGMSEARYVELVRSLDERVAGVDGKGFVQTPFGHEAGLSEALGLQVWVKNETGNVSGSHKARHLMGIAVYLLVLRELGISGVEKPRLAIASCGNAALAAATVAAALEYPIDVFIPTDANPVVLQRLEGLGASLNISERRPGESGDPCFLRFKEALAEGALPFGCQGSENGLTIEGGLTLGYELAGGSPLERLFIQVGGGALGSGIIQALRESVALGKLSAMPVIHCVQTQGAAPLCRAYERLASRLAERFGASDESTAPRALALKSLYGSAEFESELAYAAHHRSEFMWPWEEVPHSAAHGILDDETYDWFELVRGMLESGGYPLTVSEEHVLEGHRLAHRHTDIPVCCTGSSGLAGLLQLRERRAVGAEERLGLLFTGAER